MRGVHIFEKPCYREIRVMRGRAMRGLPVCTYVYKIFSSLANKYFKIWLKDGSIIFFHTDSASYKDMTFVI